MIRQAFRTQLDVYRITPEGKQILKHFEIYDKGHNWFPAQIEWHEGNDQYILDNPEITGSFTGKYTLKIVKYNAEAHETARQEMIQSIKKILDQYGGYHVFGDQSLDVWNIDSTPFITVETETVEVVGVVQCGTFKSPV